MLFIKLYQPAIIMFSWFFNMALLSSRNGISLVGRYFSFKFIGIVIVLAAVIFIFIAPLVLQLISPGYSAIKKYSSVAECTQYSNAVLDFSMSATGASEDIRNSYAPECSSVLKSGVLYCQYDDTKKVYEAPKSPSEDQKYACPLIASSSTDLDTYLGRTPALATGESQQLAIITFGIVVSLVLLHYMLTSTAIRNVRSHI